MEQPRRASRRKRQRSLSSADAPADAQDQREPAGGGNPKDRQRVRLCATGSAPAPPGVFADKPDPPMEELGGLPSPGVSPLGSPAASDEGGPQELAMDVPEIGDGHFFSMRVGEREYQPSPDYLRLQPSLSPRMRAILFDWLLEVSSEYLLTRETAQAAMNLVDRFLGQMPVQRQVLQLVGVASLSVAAKMTEIWPPRARDFALSTDNAFTVEQIASMEHHILRVLEWRVAPVTPYAWTAFYFQEMSLMMAFRRRQHQLAAQGESTDIVVERCGAYSFPFPTGFPADLFDRVMDVLDCAMLGLQALSFYPSMLAAAALIVVFPQADWPAIVRVTRYDEAELRPAVRYVGLFAGLPHNTRPHPRQDLIDKDWPREEQHALARHNIAALPFLKRLEEVAPSGSSSAAAAAAAAAAASSSGGGGGLGTAPTAIGTAPTAIGTAPTAIGTAPTAKAPAHVTDSPAAGSPMAL